MNVPYRTSFVALGSNLGDRAALLEQALCELDAVPGTRVDAVSRFHETAAEGGPPGQGDFLNAVARIETRLAPEDLLAHLQRIESAHGRDRSHEERSGPRTLDLDLCWMAGETRTSEHLQLPHPRMEARLFVLEPLADVAPRFVLPGCGLPVRERIEALRGAPANS